VNLLGKDTYDPSGQGRGIRIENNLFEDVDGARWGGDGEFLKVSAMPELVVSHNTVMQSGNILATYGVASVGFEFANNVVKHNNYGMIGVNQGVGQSTLGVYFPGSMVRRNVLVGADGSLYPVDNFYPTKLMKVGFVDAARGDYRFKTDSPYRGRATDGKDVGCDFEALSAATAGVASRPGN
jgi:hypothetical protein